MYVKIYVYENNVYENRFCIRFYSDRDENLVSNVLNEKITYNVIRIPSLLTNTEDPPRHSDFTMV